jgi:hypothetical protein
MVRNSSSMGLLKTAARRISYAVLSKQVCLGKQKIVNVRLKSDIDNLRS